VITDDNRIRRRPAERQLRATLQLTTIFLPGGLANLKLWDQAERLIKWWPSIQKAAQKLPVGCCAIVSMNGKVDDLRDP
jgi:hypothetical protein